MNTFIWYNIQQHAGTSCLLILSPHLTTQSHQSKTSAMMKKLHPSTGTMARAVTVATIGVAPLPQKAEFGNICPYLIPYLIRFLCSSLISVSLGFLTCPCSSRHRSSELMCAKYTCCCNSMFRPAARMASMVTMTVTSPTIATIYFKALLLLPSPLTLFSDSVIKGAMRKDRARMIQDTRWLSKSSSCWMTEWKSSKRSTSFRNTSLVAPLWPERLAENFGLVWLNISRTCFSFKPNPDLEADVNPDSVSNLEIASFNSSKDAFFDFIALTLTKPPVLATRLEAFGVESQFLLPRETSSSVVTSHSSWRGAPLLLIV